jgi:hypothetical protein
MRGKRSNEQSFWQNTSKGINGSCWLWTGCLTTSGYGHLNYHGKKWQAHRLAYVFAKGEIPSGMKVRQSCGNTLCCLPEHLYLSTSKEIINDTRKRGLFPPPTPKPGSKNPQWKGGRTISSHGYVLIKTRVCKSGGYTYEHRLVAESMLGRPLLPTEIVHHKDGNKQNNNPENLMIASSSLHHQSKHRKRTGLRLPDEPNLTIPCECGCGKLLNKYDSHNRPRKYISGHNMKELKLDEQDEHSVV